MMPPALPSPRCRRATPTTPSKPGARARQGTVVGSGHVQGVPDTLTVQVGIEFTAPDVTAAMDQTNDRQQAVPGALAGARIERKDVSTTVCESTDSAEPRAAPGAQKAMPAAVPLEPGQPDGEPLGGRGVEAGLRPGYCW